MKTYLLCVGDAFLFESALKQCQMVLYGGDGRLFCRHRCSVGRKDP